MIRTDGRLGKSSMRPPLHPPAPAANGVDMKGRSVWEVRRTDVHSVTQALQRVQQNPKLARLVLDALQDERTVIWLWGERGLAICSILENALDGRFAFFVYVQNEPGFRLKELSPIAEVWARGHGCARIAAAVDREGPWARLTGYAPWKLVIAKDLGEGT